MRGRAMRCRRCCARMKLSIRLAVRDIEALTNWLETLSDDKRGIIALQPISQKEDATRLCIETRIARNWRPSHADA